MANRAITPFGELKRHMSYANDAQTLQYCLGVIEIDINDHKGQPLMQNAQFIARQLAKHTILITIDCEHYTLNSSELTEIGIATLKRTDVIEIAQRGKFGDHGENLMRRVKYHFLRLKEKTHLLTSNPASRGPAGNRFGEGRFVTFEEAREYLRKLMIQPITGVPALHGFNHPIVVMGHAVQHDHEHLMGKDLYFNLNSLGTIVKTIDTQEIAKQLGYWLDLMEHIGLDKLVAKLDFEHTDPHTAANDAARTVICGMLMVLPTEARKNCSRSIEQVTSDAEHYSVNTFVGLGGTRLYCCHCGSSAHMYQGCNIDKRELRCKECEVRGLANDSTIHGHITLHCPIKRDEVAAQRLKWYSDQDSNNWKPKWAFDSSYFQQTFKHNAPAIDPPTSQESKARRLHYSQRKGPWVTENVFTSETHSFDRSPLKNITPTRDIYSLPRDPAGLPIIPPSVRYYGPSSHGVLPRGGDFQSGVGRGSSDSSTQPRGTNRVSFGNLAPRGGNYGAVTGQPPGGVRRSGTNRGGRGGSDRGTDQ